MIGRTYEGSSVAEIYSLLYNDIKEAKQLHVRGSKTKEIIAPQILLTNPRSRVAYHKDRKWNINYAIAEALLLFLQEDSLKYFTFFNRNMEMFSDDGFHVQGAYGRRIAEYIPDIINKIKNDKFTRQAAITILQANDVAKETKDMPCTLSVQFLWRSGKLNMITNMRSNDIIWGFSYDVFMFTVMQEIIANECNMEVGWYLHRPASLHLYERHYDLFENVAKSFEEKEMEKLDYNYKQFEKEALNFLDLVNAFNRIPKKNGTLLDIVKSAACKKESGYSIENAFKIK